MNPLKELLTHGQSIWLDFIRRKMLTNGELTKLIRDDGLRGMTSNPSIFEKAIAESDDYDAAFAVLAPQRLDAKSCFEQLAIEARVLPSRSRRPGYRGFVRTAESARHPARSTTDRRAISSNRTRGRHAQVRRRREPRRWVGSSTSTSTSTMNHASGRQSSRDVATAGRDERARDASSGAPAPGAGECARATGCTCRQSP